MEELITNNNATIRGRLTENFTLSHIARGEAFYVSELAVPRNSGVHDIIPITVSERLIDVKGLETGDCVEIQGQMRSLRKKELAKFPVYLFAREIKSAETPENFWINEVNLCGIFFSKKDLHRTSSGREAINIRVLIDRKYGKSDCISCVLWGRNARFADTLNVGDILDIKGRVQSRVYRPATNTRDEKRCIEVSVYQIEKKEINDKTTA